MNAGPFRLGTGGCVDRAQALRFTFNGRSLEGLAGDTLASALLAAGVRVVGRGLKFHRPRGILSAGIEEPNALLTVGSGNRSEPSVRATVQPLFEGLTACSQNCWPSLTFDIGRLNDALYRLFPAGFYNKTFMWPGWHAFEPFIRRVAGLGVAPEGADPDRYDWRNAHCDVLVVGGGAAGMLAAHLAARSGARVILTEADSRTGGGLNWDRRAPTAFQQTCELAADIRVLTRTTAVGFYDHGLVTAVERADSGKPSMFRERWWRIRARRIVLASGAIEQPLAFPYNDRPGIMLADAVRHYLNRYAVAAGRRVAVATNNDSAYQVALDLRAAGVEVPCLIDSRAAPSEELVNAVTSAGVAVHNNARITRTHGKTHIEALDFNTATGGESGRQTRIDCDALAMSGGWNPAAHLYCQAGGRLQFDTHDGCFVPDGKSDSVHVVGAAAGHFDMRTALDRTHETLAKVLASLAMKMRDDGLPWPTIPSARARAATGALGYTAGALRDRAWLDFQHDVTVSDIDLAVAENLTSVEHVKRYTTVGMCVDQGKTSNLNALAVLAERTGRAIPEVGTTTFRPMFVPVTLGAIAGGRVGKFFRPKRLLPAHDKHVALGAHFEDYGSWQRPSCYPQPGETHSAAIRREVQAVRDAVGLFDGSALGKLRVRGPDAAEFLDRMYANTMGTLPAGQARYGILLNEQGIVIDDGVCARLSNEEFWVNTTSSGAARISAWFDEWLQGEWPELRVVVTDVTSGWATLNLAGPRAREVLAALEPNIALARDDFRHMQLRQGSICAVPCQILRASFTGELSYEISVPADFGADLLERLCSVGRPFGLTPFGVEALLILRTEKGYLHVGADTDGTTVPDDIGFGTAVSKKSADFVGRNSLSLPENTRPDRMQLVGLRCVGDAAAFVAGAHLLDTALTQPPQSSAGYLTSAVFSPSLARHVGMGLLKNGRARLGQTVYLFNRGQCSVAEVVNAAHYDPTGARLNA